MKCGTKVAVTGVVAAVVAAAAAWILGKKAGLKESSLFAAMSASRRGTSAAMSGLNFTARRPGRSTARV